MNNRRGLCAALLTCLVVLSVVLVGCGNGAAEAKAAFVGTWDLVEMEENGETTNKSELDSMRSLGLEVYLELNEDGKGKLSLFGSDTEGTWEASSPTAAKITLEGQSVDMTISDGKLSMTQGTSKLTFEKGEARAASNGTADDGTSEATPAEDPVTFETPVSIADDDVCTIVATGKKDYLGDPSFVLTVTNKGDKTLYLTSTSGSFSVAGKQIDPIIGVTVAPGATDNDVEMWFSADTLGSSSLAGLSEVKGTIEVWDNDTNQTLGSYEVSL